MDDFKHIVKEICDELNINMQMASKDWMIILEKNGIRKFLLGTKFDLNSYALGSIFDDKYATYEMLKNLNLPVIEHEILFSPRNKCEFALGSNLYSDALTFFEKNNQNIVIKVNNGHQGKGVYHVTNEKDIKIILDCLFVNNYSLSLCPYYDIKSEYRVIMLDDYPELIYKKIKPIIIGDGQSTVKQLLQKLNQSFTYNKDVFSEKEYSRVLDKGEVFEYNWQFNLSNGASMTMEIDKSVKNDVLNLAVCVAKKCGLRFASVDIIELHDGSLMVLEINCGVATKHFREIHPNGYEIAKNIYKKAIMKMFNL
ncbi:MAG: hypothetical protein E7164_00685 [Firmicutes bacterium]|nr:hypothetical protein [Bacillota bacterium]